MKMMINTNRPLLKIAGIVNAVAIILAITFHIIQNQRQGCWTGNETTNFQISEDKVMCCNNVPLIECGFDALQCFQTGSAPHCQPKMCISCFILWGIAGIAFCIICIEVFKLIR
jgi:hypothetical protein